MSHQETLPPYARHLTKKKANGQKSIQAISWFNCREYVAELTGNVQRRPGDYNLHRRELP